jgi:GNAT superfamily N-acetyltransferase
MKVAGAPNIVNTDHLHWPELIKDVAPAQVPRTAASLFSNESRSFTAAKALKLGDFIRLMAIEFDDGQTTYFAQHDQTYEHVESTERLVYLADINGLGRVIGSGEIRLSLTDTDPFFLNKPFVGNTATQPEFRGKGLGRRRLLAMNAATLLMYNLVLNSDTLRSAPASSVWQRLVNDGLAETYWESSGLAYKPSNSRFKFKEQPPVQSVLNVVE